MSEEEPKIGVYVCHCGANIAGVVDVEDVIKYVEKLPNVAIAKHYVYMCSAPAQAMIKEDIEEHRLNRVVVASCSPRMHESTFRRVVDEGGLNPYLFEMTNIREQCSWVHATEPKKATKKAKDLIRISVARARLLEPLQKRVVNVTGKALIIGAGVSGMRAALDLAGRGFDVYLVEKAPYVGGRMAQLDKLYPTDEYALDVLKPLTQAVVSEPKIHLLTNSEISTADGYIGNFKTRIAIKPRYVTVKCDACGKCEIVCPIEVPDEFDYGLSKRKAVYLPFPDAIPKTYLIDHEKCSKCGKCIETCESGAIDLYQQPQEIEVEVGTIIVATGHDLYDPPEGEYGRQIYKNVITMPQLERLLNRNGPTNGELRLSCHTPKSVVFISCVGSRQEPEIYKRIKDNQQFNRYCSRVCCTATLRNASEIKRRYSHAQVFYLHRDIRSFGRGHEEYYIKAGQQGVVFIRYKPEEPPVVSNNRKGTIVTVHDVLSGETLAIPTDLVVLNAAMVPRADASEIQTKLKIARSVDGFFQEAHAKLRPLDTPMDGIYLAGTAQGPRDITDSAAMGSAAAAKAAILLAKGKVELEPIVAYVDLTRCDGCAMCVEPCTFKAIAIEEYEQKGTIKKRAVVNDALCKGCGACAATCPPKCIYVRHFTLDQISAMIKAAVTE